MMIYFFKKLGPLHQLSVYRNSYIPPVPISIFFFFLWHNMNQNITQVYDKHVYQHFENMANRIADRKWKMMIIGAFEMNIYRQNYTIHYKY